MFSHGHSHDGQACHGHGGPARNETPSSGHLPQQVVTSPYQLNITPEKMEALQQLYAQGRLVLPGQMPGQMPVPGQQAPKASLPPGQENIDPKLLAMMQQVAYQQQMMAQNQAAMMQQTENADATEMFHQSMAAAKMMSSNDSNDQDNNSVCSNNQQLKHSCGDEKKQKMAAMQQTLSSVCHAILRQKPEAVNEKDDDGNTILHRVCESGMDQLVMLLLDNNADINAVNKNGQTPVHMACRSGKTMLVHMMKENGANLEAVDNDGWTVMHHTAAGGSVHVIIYLCEVCGLNVHDLNNKQQSLLHLAAEQDQEDMVHYLLKNNRCDIHREDNNSNTAMHLVCMKGHKHLGWKLLSHGGLKMLHVTNKENADPIDLCNRGRSPVHFEMSLALHQYYVMKEPNFKPDRPLKAWYGQFYFPHLYLIGAAIIASIIMPENQGWLCFAGAACTMQQIFDNEHRMGHISRFPSPSRLGGFTGGFLTTTLCFLVVTAPVVVYGDPWLVLLFLSLLPFGGYAYYQLVFGDPGYVTQSKQKENMGGPYTMRDLVVVLGRPQAMCVRCELIPSKPTKHCKLCDRCVYEMDHHCLYTTSCIGHKNHRLFVLFTVAIMLLQLIFVMASYSFICQTRLGSITGIRDAFYYLFYYHGWLCTLTVLNSAWWFFGLTVLWTQFGLISKGYTFVFQPTNKSHQCALSTFQRFTNVLNFLIGRSDKIVRDPLYQV